MDLEPSQLTIGSHTFDLLAAGDEGGDGVLFLHGFPQSADSWRRVMPTVAAAGRHRCVAPSLRGYSPGARPTEPDAYAMGELVGDVEAIADGLGWDRFHLVGHDWGGALAWHFAGRHPERLRTLTVLSTPHPAAFLAAKAAGPSSDGDDQAEKSKYMDDFRTPGFEDTLLADDRALLRFMIEAAGMDPESQELVLEHFTGTEEMVGALNWYRGADPTDAAGMGPITTPTLYVWSTEDIALGRTAAEATVDHVEGPYRFEVLNGITHWIPEEAAGAVIDLLVSHLDSDG